MDRCAINPIKGRNEGHLPPTGLFLLNPSDCRALPDLASRYGLERRTLFHSTLFSGPSWFAAGPALGSPAAVLCLEKLIVLGARRIIVYGWCGSLSRSCQVGDLILPTWGLSEEGTSGHYQTPPDCRPDASLRAVLGEGLEAAGVRLHEGPVWTTDAPYRETIHKVDRYGAQGILGVEMEFSALCCVARFRGIRLAGAMLVSDEVWRQPWSPAFTGKPFRGRSRGLCALLAEDAASGRYDA